MAQTIEMKATVRKRAGKGAARAARREGKIPAVIYGDNKPAENITLDYNVLQKQYMKGHFTSNIVELDVDGKKHSVIPRDVQTDPVRDFPIHVDFLRVSAKTQLQVEVPVQFTNEDVSPGLKRGGALNVVRHTIDVSCRPDKIPQFFEVDLSEADIGDSIHWSDLKIPEGVTSVISDRDFTIATIAGASAKGGEEEEEAEAAAAEGEEDAKAEGAAEGDKGEEKKD